MGKTWLLGGAALLAVLVGIFAFTGGGDDMSEDAASQLEAEDGADGDGEETDTEDDDEEDEDDD